METARDENILPLESFDWLEQDERATFWLWAYICKAGDYELGIDKPANAEFRKELVSANESECISDKPPGKN